MTEKSKYHGLLLFLSGIQMCFLFPNVVWCGQEVCFFWHQLNNHYHVVTTRPRLRKRSDVKLKQTSQQPIRFGNFKHDFTETTRKFLHLAWISLNWMTLRLNAQYFHQRNARNQVCECVSGIEKVMGKIN